MPGYYQVSAVKKTCRICDKKILVSSADFSDLCIVCGDEFREMMVAVAELSSELEKAYSTSPGIPLEEIAIRMELNRIKKIKSD